MHPHISPRLRRAIVLAVGGAGLVVLGGCSQADQTSIKRLAQPVGASDRTAGIHHLWMWAWLAAIVVGVIVWGLIGYACIKFRRRRDDEIPVQTRYNLPIEILYTVAPVVMVLVFFYFTVREQDAVFAAPASGQPQHVVTVVGQQWSWTFNYDKDPALNGSATVYDGGTTADFPTLWLPVDKSVKFELRSPDVIHSFWVPAFLFKMDVIPGRNNNFTLTPTREGTFQGKCAELCGVYHSRMLFTVKVVSPSRYAAHLATLQKAGKIGPALGGSETDTQAGLGNNDLQGDGE